MQIISKINRATPTDGVVELQTYEKPQLSYLDMNVIESDVGNGGDGGQEDSCLS